MSLNFAAKPCLTAEEDSSPPADPVRVCMRSEQLAYVQHFLDRIKLRVFHDEYDASSKYHFVLVDRSKLRMFLQRLYFAQISLYNLENWYQPLRQLEASSSASNQKSAPQRPLTAPSLFMPLSDTDLKLIQRIYAARLLGGDESGLSRRDLDNLISLERRINDTMKEGGKKYYFARLSTRSPKDGAPKVAQNDHKSDSTAEATLRDKQQSLKISTPQEVMTLLTRSQRVFGDIKNFLEFRASFAVKSRPEEEPRLNLILREWIDDLEPQREFRCYVNQGHINAISQYYCYDAFEEYQASSRADVELTKIRDAVIAFHDQVRATFAELVAASYVFDVVVFRDYSVQIVELNPFGAHMSSGAALFNWETDAKLLLSDDATAQPVIRVLERLQV